MISRSFVAHPRLEGAYLKVQRSAQHLKVTQDEVRRVTAANAYTVITDTQDEGREHLWRIEGLKPLNPHISLWVGDCLHNLRSALDHGAYEIHPCPSKRTFFPLLAEKPAKPVYIAPEPVRTPLR